MRPPDPIIPGDIVDTIQIGIHLHVALAPITLGEPLVAGRLYSYDVTFLRRWRSIPEHAHGRDHHIAGISDRRDQSGDVSRGDRKAGVRRLPVPPHVRLSGCAPERSHVRARVAGSPTPTTSTALQHLERARKLLGELGRTGTFCTRPSWSWTR